MQELKNRNEVCLSNSLVASKYSLTREEQNLVLLVASQVRKSDADFKTYKVSVADLNKATGVKHNAHRIKELSLSIMKKPLVIPGTRAVVNWFSCIEPVDKETSLKVRFDKRLKPYLLDLETYTQAELSIVFAFKSKYSSRLYFLLKSVYGTQKSYTKRVVIAYETSSLIDMFTMPTSYSQRYSMFKDRFLEVAVDEINNHTDIELNIEYTELKTGRKITSIEFLISEKKKTVKQLRKAIEQTKTVYDYIPESLSSQALGILTSEELGLQVHDVKNIFDHYQIGDIEQICGQMFKSWDNKRLMSRIALFRGEFKKLNQRKKQNYEIQFGFDEVKKMCPTKKKGILDDAKDCGEYTANERDWASWLMFQHAIGKITVAEREELLHR